MKNVHANNANEAIQQYREHLSPDSPSFWDDWGVGDQPHNMLCDAMVRRSAPHIVIDAYMVSVEGEAQNRRIVGSGYRLGVAYRRVEGQLEQAFCDGYRLSHLSVAVLVESPTGASYRYCCKFDFYGRPVSREQLLRVAGGERSGRAIIAAASAIYYARHLGLDATEGDMYRDMAALDRIDKDAHAAQMRLSRRYGGDHERRWASRA